MYRRVCAVDAGYRNFAWCVVDSNNWRTPLRWVNEELWQHDFKPNNDDIVHVTVQWCRRNKALLDQCDVIILEKQMRDRFLIMNACIHALFFGKVQSVDPRTIGAHYKLPRKRAEKKPAGVAVARSYGVEFPVAYKLDDYADAWLMATYGLFHGGLPPK